MPFICPNCTAHTLKIHHTLELPPGAYDDEITLQTVACARCGLQALAVYRESRRGALDSESWHHDGYLVDEAHFRAVSDAIQRCPAPTDPSCQCPVHHSLAQTSDGAWDGLQKSGIKIRGLFQMAYGS